MLKFWHIRFWSLINFHVITIFVLIKLLLPIFKPSVCCYLFFFFRKPDMMREHVKVWNQRLFSSYNQRLSHLLFSNPTRSPFTIYNRRLPHLFLLNPTCSTSFSNPIKGKDTVYNQINDETSISTHKSRSSLYGYTKWNLCFIQQKMKLVFIPGKKDGGICVCRLWTFFLSFLKIIIRNF